MKASTIDKIIRYGTYAAGAYFVGITIAGSIKRKRAEGTNGIGAAERIKRRIYKEVSLAQQAGVDFSKKYNELTAEERNALEDVGKSVGWKQSKRSIESGKPYVESYFGSLRRAWNAVSGVIGIGAAEYTVYDRNGNIALNWYDNAAEHIEHEPEAKVLLALPPHVEPKKTKAQKAKDDELRQREDFASNFMREYIDDDVVQEGKGYAGVKIDMEIVNLLKKTISKYGQQVKPFDIILYAWANKKYKINKNQNNVKFTFYLDGKEYYAPLYKGEGKIFLILDQYYKIWLDDAGWREHNDELDDIRMALLDKAKHMHVKLPEDIYDKDYKKLSDESQGGYVRGDERYNYLPYINWVLWTHTRYERGGDTYYPMFSFDTKEEAMKYKYGWNTQNKPDHGNGWKILPIWDVPIEKITGL